MSILLPFGVLYGWIIDLRNYFYDSGILKTHDLGARTISVGNLTTGGTGKTPLVALIAEILADNGERVCILTRGYGRNNERERVLVSDGDQVLADSEIGGDEPVELAHKLIGKAIVIADADRVAAAKWAKDKFEISTFILDDAFQHRRAKRHIDIVCIDATNPFGNGRVIPAGNLRESYRNLKRADAVVITRAEQIADTSDLETRLGTSIADIPILRASTKITSFVPLEEFPAKTESAQSGPVENAFIFCGIANPENFVRTVENFRIKIAGSLILNDHARYDLETLKRIEAEANSSNAKSLITTAKDAVKLNATEFTMPCYAAIAETVIEDQEAFRHLITSFSKAAPSYRPNKMP